MRMFARAACVPLFAMVAVGTACGDDATTTSPQPFALRFTALAGAQPASCTSQVPGLGPAGTTSIGLSDLRFYVSDLQLFAANGEALASTLEQNEFQYASAAGSVALVDLTSNLEGSCSGTAATAAEGTERTHDAITGTTLGGPIAAVSFAVGVPQALMRETIAAYSPEGAPSPLDEMYWNWASGYRHLLLSFTIGAPGSEAGGEGYVHVGSRNCGPQDGLALEDRESCEFVNTPIVSLPEIDPSRDGVGLDVTRLLQGLDFVAPVYDTETFEVIGQGPGVECHSSPTQPDCLAVFANLGIDMASGAADSAQNTAFVVTR